MVPAGKTKPVVAALAEEQRQLAMERFAVLRPHLEEVRQLQRGPQCGAGNLQQIRQFRFRAKVRPDRQCQHLPQQIVKRQFEDRFVAHGSILV